MLTKINPSMIKMDIKALKTDTLLGSKSLIAKHKPDVAISVYHRLEDYIVIPTMLKEWVPEYKFYLRAHSYGTIDTVLYATI